MWIMTTKGFFSAVRDEDNPKRVMVRARDRADLENLVAWANKHPYAVGSQTLEIIENQGTDYPCRVFIDKRAWAVFVSDVAVEIDYTNFKSRIAEIPEQRDKGHFYHEVWAAMRRWQGFREGVEVTFGPARSSLNEQRDAQWFSGQAGVASSRRNGSGVCSYCGKKLCECLPKYEPGAVACGICERYPCICPRDQHWDMSPLD